MKKAKIKERKELKDEMDLGNNIRTGLIVLLAIIVIFIAFYLLTDYLLSKNSDSANPNEDKETKETTDIIFNKLLAQSEDEYYVFAILETDKNKSVYNVYAKDLEDVYYINMSDSFNKNHIGKVTNITENAKDIIISDTTLFYIKDGKIEEYKTGSEDILNYLKELIKVETE